LRDFPSPVSLLTHKAVGERGYFIIDDGLHGEQLWTSDGTVDGTRLLHEFTASVSSQFSNTVFVAGGRVYFIIDDGVHGKELWASDGTVGGTRVADIRPGNDGSSPTHLTDVNGVVYFLADDGTHGVEVWRSDGTAGGTELAFDFLPGSGSSSVHDLVGFKGSLYFGANDGLYGDELWRYTPDPSPPRPGDFDADGDVDRVDLAILTRNYGVRTGATAASGDLDGDGIVGLTDLRLFRNYFAVNPASSPPAEGASQTPTKLFARRKPTLRSSRAADQVISQMEQFAPPKMSSIRGARARSG
jgi:ELWxxDGT repeat protein